MILNFIWKGHHHVFFGGGCKIVQPIIYGRPGIHTKQQSTFLN